MDCLVGTTIYRFRNLPQNGASSCRVFVCCGIGTAEPMSSMWWRVASLSDEPASALCRRQAVERRRSVRSGPLRGIDWCQLLSERIYRRNALIGAFTGSSDRFERCSRIGEQAGKDSSGRRSGTEGFQHVLDPSDDPPPLNRSTLKYGSQIQNVGVENGSVIEIAC